MYKNDKIKVNKMNPEKQLEIVLVKICHNLDFIKSCIDDKPDEAKELITEIVDEITNTLNE
jgi:hypothetical protein